jgi:peptidoglycan/xylan/chitin deacetylase (PgdA/CDA1 family)
MPRPLRTSLLARATSLLLVGLALGGCAAGAPGALPPTPGQAILAPTSADLAALPTGAAQIVATLAPTTPPLPPTAVPAATATPAPAAPTARPQLPPPADPSRATLVDAGTSGRREIAITFDAGADRGNAESILDTLAAYGVRASFGITGAWASEHPDLVARMAAEGHQIINHSWSHGSFTGYSTGGAPIDASEAAVELARTTSAISAATGGYDTRPWFRPPYGDYEDALLATLAAEGYPYVAMWTCDTLGWNGLTADEIYDRCVATATPGDIILMHVGEGAPGDIAVLPRMIETLLADGYTFVTVEQLVQP